MKSDSPTDSMLEGIMLDLSLSLFQAMDEAGYTIEDVAEGSGLSVEFINDVLECKNPKLTFGDIGKIACAIGCQVNVKVFDKQAD